MKNEMNKDRMLVYQNSILGLSDRYNNIYSRMNSLIDAGYGEKAGKNEVTTLLSSIKQTKEKLEKVADAIRVLVEESAEEENKASSSISGTSVQEKKYGYADGILVEVAMSNATPYSCMEYDSYCLAKEEMFRFSDYNDTMNYAIEFMHSGFGNLLALKDVNNFSLMVTVAVGKTDEYTDLLAQQALRSTLDSMDDVVTILPELPEDMKKVFDVLFKAGDNWKSVWDKVYDSEGGKRGNVAYDENDLDPVTRKLRDLIDGMSESEAEQLNAFFSVFTDAEKFAKKGEKGWEIIKRLFADYSSQLNYLDAIEKSFTRNGYISSNMKKDIDSLRSQYNSIVYEYLSKKATEEIKALEGVAVTRLCEEFPGLGAAVGALNLTSSVVEKTYKEEISAAYSLYGSMQYDQALVNNYSHYVDLIAKNLATEEEIREAESLYQVIKATKISEYKNMITLEKWKIREGKGSNETLKYLQGRLDSLQKLGLRAENLRAKVTGNQSHSDVNGC